MKLALTCVALLLSLAACSTTSIPTELASTGTALSAGLVAADAYFKLPVCGHQQTGQVCKDPATVAKIQTAYHFAVSAYVTAGQLQTATSVSAAQTAVSSLAALTPAIAQ